MHGQQNIKISINSSHFQHQYFATCSAVRNKRLIHTCSRQGMLPFCTASVPAKQSISLATGVRGWLSGAWGWPLTSIYCGTKKTRKAASQHVFTACCLTLQIPVVTYTYHQVYHSTVQSSAPHSVFVCFVWIWEQTAIISLYNINWLVCITETVCVYCAVRTE